MGLLENLLARLLSEKAGDFLKVSKEQLHASLSGDLTLSNVELRTDALNSLIGNSPVALRSCKVGTLKAKIPWDHLSSRSVRISLSNVEVVLGPQAVDKNAPGDSWRDVIKRQRLAATEVLMREQLKDPVKKPTVPVPGAEDEDSDPDDAEEPQKRMRMSLLQRIVARVADNIVVTLENVHVRFEDGDSSHASKFALGVHLDSLSLATDASGSSAFVDRTVKPPPALLRRRVQVHGLNVFWEALASSSSRARRHLVRPFGVTVALTQHLALDAPVAISLEAKTEGVVSVMLDTEEYRDVVELTERITAHESFVTQSAIWRLRPKEPPSADPRGWWLYAVRAVQTVLRSTKDETAAQASLGRSSWPRLIRLLRTRLRYVHFFKQRLIKSDPKFLTRAGRLAVSSSSSSAVAAAAAATADASVRASDAGSDHASTLQRQSSFSAGPSAGTGAALAAAMADADEGAAVLGELELELPFNTIMLFRAMAEAEFREERARLRKLHRGKRMTVRALSAMAQGAAASKKMLSQSFRFGSSSQLSASAAPGAAASQTPAPELLALQTWAMDTAEKNALYKSVALDPSTAWLIEHRATNGGAGGGGALNMAVELHLRVPLVLVSLSLSPKEPIMDVGLGVITVDAKLGVGKQKYAVEAQLQSLDFVDKTPRAFADFRGIPGTLRTLADDGRPLLKLSVLATAASGSKAASSRETIGIAVEVRPMDVTLSLGLINRLVQLGHANQVATLAPATMERMRQLGRRTAQDLNQALKKVVDVKVDWDLPTVLVPLFSHSPGTAVALDVALGRLRVRSQSAKHQIECHGAHAGVRRMEQQSSLAQWKALDVATSVPILSKLDVDVAVTQLPAGITARVDVSPVIVRIEPALIAGVVGALALYTLPGLPPAAAAAAAAASPARARLPANVDLTAAMPKIEVVLSVPRYRQGLRAKRPCWGADFTGAGDVLPASGVLRARVNDVVLSVKEGALSLTVGGLGVRDEVQCAGLPFRDVLSVGALAVTLAEPGPRVAVRTAAPIVVAWNPSTVDAVAELVHALSPPASSAATSVPATTPAKAATALRLQLDLPDISMHLNQETIASRLAIIQLIGLAVSVAPQHVAVRLSDLTIQCVQWEPLTSTTGVKLLGRGLASDDDAALPRDERLLDLEVNLKGPITRVTFEARRLRFLWAHTLTKQVADYFSDGVAGMFKPRGAVIDNGGGGGGAATAATATGESAKLAVLIEGKVVNAAVAVPRIRFGKNQRYVRGGSTDEILASVAQVDLGVSLFAPRPPVAGEALYRADDHGCVGDDASLSACLLPPPAGALSGLEYQEPAVEIRMAFTGVDLRAVHRKQRRVNVLATGIAGKLSWHIVDFSPAQRAVRAKQSPLTAREQARMDADVAATGGAIPYGEHPHGVSPQKFELAVDADAIRMNASMDDVLLIGGVVLDNILDHRRRLACVPAPRLPLFSEDERMEVGNEMAAASDELVGGAERGDTAVYHAHSKEVLPPGLDAAQLAHDALGFGGQAPPFVDLDLSLRFPTVFVALRPLDTSLPPVARVAAMGFEMTLSELYDRTQVVDIALQQVLVEVPDPSRARTPGKNASPPMPLRRHASSAPPASETEYVTIVEAGEPRRKLYGNPAVHRTRVKEVVHMWQQRAVHNTWMYERVAAPVHVVVTRWPAKDRRIDVGVNQVEVNPDLLALSVLAASLPPMPAAKPNAGAKVGRAEVVELHVSKFAARWRRPVSEPELVVKGCAKVVVAANRAGKQRVAVETRLAVALRTSTSDALEAEDAPPVPVAPPQAQARERPSLQSADEVAAWLEAVYRTHNPVKLAEVGSIVHAFDGHFDELVAMIRSKYGMLDDDFVVSTPALLLAKDAASKAGARHAAFRRHEMLVLDPFGARVDVGMNGPAMAVTVVCEPMRGHLTNGQVEACRAIVLAATASLGQLSEFRPPSATSMAAATTRPPPPPRRDSGLQLNVIAQGAHFQLINDYGSSHSIPLVRLCVSGVAVKYSSALADGVLTESLAVNAVAPVHAQGEPGVSLDSFNPRILAWESLVEPCSFAVSLERETVHKAEVRRLAVQVNFDKGLDVNFTYAFVESFAYWLACRAARRRGSFNLGSRHAEHYVVNDSGAEICFWADGFEDDRVVLPPKARAGLRLSGGPRSSFEAAAERGLFRDTRADLRIGEVVEASALALAQLQDDDAAGSLARRRAVSLNLGWPAAAPLAASAPASAYRLSLLGAHVDRFGTYVYSLQSAAGEPVGKITLHVSLEHGSRVIRVLSPVQVVNATALPLVFLLSGPEHKQQAIGPLQPGETAPLPVDCLTWSFCYRPLAQPSAISADRERGPDLDLDAARATSNAADALGYTWSPMVSLLDIHTLVDRPLTMACPRSRSFTYEGRGRAKSEDGVGGGATYLMATCMGVESFASSDAAGKRETYVVTVAPLIKVENRLPMDLLLRSLRKEGDANLPVSGHRIEPGKDADLAHVVARSTAQPASAGATTGAASASASKRGSQSAVVPATAAAAATATAPAQTAMAASPSSPRTSDLAAAADDFAPLWLSVCVPGLGWSQPFVAGSVASLVLAHKGTVPLRLMFENERLPSGSVRVTVYAESWLLNDARLPIAFREGVAAGETFISEIGQRGGAAAQLMYELGHNLRDRAFNRTASSSSGGGGGRPTALRGIEGDDAAAAAEQPPEDALSSKVVLFSEGRMLSLRVGDAAATWSSAVAIDTVGAHRDLVCPAASGGSSAERAVVSLAIKLAPGKFRRTRVVVVHPRLVVVNRVPGYALRVASEQALRPVSIETGVSLPVHFFDAASLKAAEETAAANDDALGKGNDAAASGGGAPEEAREVTRVFPRMVVALDGTSDSWGWSGAFRVSDAGKLALKVHSRHSGETRVLRVLFAPRGPTTAVVIEPENNAHPMYRILNQSDEVMHYYQALTDRALFGSGQGKKRRGVVERVFNGEARAFGWDEPTAEALAVALSFRGDSFVHECSIDALSTPVALQLSASKSHAARQLWVAVRIRGTTKTLVVTSTSPERDTRATAATAVAAAHERARVQSDGTPPISLSVYVARIGLSLVDRAPQELLLVTLSNVRVECARTLALPTVDEDEIESAGLDSLDLSVHLVQVDSQLPDAYFPVMLGPARSWLALAPADRQHVFQLSLVRRNGHAGEFDFFEFASLHILEMDLKIDDTILLLLGRMMWECVMSLRTEEELVVGQVLSKEGPASRLRRWLVAAPPAVARDAAAQPADSDLASWIADMAFVMPQSFDRDIKRAYFKLLHLQGIRLNVSFRFTASDPRAVLSLAKFRSSGSMRGDDFNEGVLGRPALFDVDLVMSWLPPALINIDNARLRMHALYAPHMLVDREQLLDTVARHYSQQALYQVYRVVGSSDLIGNPLGVLRDIGAGVEDFFSRPMQGILRASPLLFVQGLGQGTFSLLRHATLGSFDFLSKLSGAVGAGVALLTLDHRFVSQRWTRLRFEQPGGAGAGLAMGFRALMHSFIEGAGGVIIGPMRSLMNEGSAFGFARELGLGVVGVFVKPVVGVLDLASRAATGIRASVESFDGRAIVAAQRQRLPRAFKGPERRLDPFVLEEAFVADLLKRLEGDSASFDYLGHVALHGAYCLVCGGGRLWCLDYSPPKGLLFTAANKKSSVVWSVPLPAVVGLAATAEPNFPALHVQMRKPSDVKRVRPRDGRHGAEDAELVVRGGGVDAAHRAVLVVPFDSHERARFACELLSAALFRHGTTNGALSSSSSSSPGEQPPPPPRRVIGFVMGPVPRQMARELAGPSHVGGVGVVVRVIEGSPAQRAGLREGDVVLSIGGVALDVEDPWATVREASMGEPRELDVEVRRPPGRTQVKMVIPL